MNRSEHAPGPAAPPMTPDNGAPQPVLLCFTADHVGPTGIAAGLKNLADGTSRAETWVIARQALPDRPQHIFMYCMVARRVSGESVSWRFCHGPDGAPLNGDSPLLLPAQGPQDLELACAQLAAHLCHLARQCRADVFRLDDTRHIPTGTPPAAAPADRIWHRMTPCRFDSMPVTTTCVRDRLVHAQQLSAEAAEHRLASVAASGGLLRIGEEWYSCVRRRALPPLSGEDYDRLVRALQIHIESCHSDRCRQGQAGNHGAARALATEEAPARHTLGLIQSLTQDLPEQTLSY